MAAPHDAFPGVAAAYVVQVDEYTPWGRRLATPLPPASLTKLMTALLVDEAGAGDETLLTVSASAAAARGARAGLRAGEQWAVTDLLTATLVASANDACLALAQWLDGAEAAFVARMNRRARELGLSGTQFRNACGHDAPGHRSTAADLLRLARAAMAREGIARRVRMAEAQVAAAGDQGRRLTLRSSNALLGRYPGVRGVKTGFTARAGRCLVALAEREGVQAWVVLLDARDRWWDAHALLDRAFAWRRTVPDSAAAQ